MADEKKPINTRESAGIAYAAIDNVRRVREQSDEAFARDTAANRPDNLAPAFTLTVALVGFATMLFMLAILFESPRLSLLFVPVLVVCALALFACKLAIHFRKHPRVRNSVAMVCTTLCSMCATLSVVPLLDAYFRLLQRNTAVPVSGDLLYASAALDWIVAILASCIVFFAFSCTAQCYSVRVDDTRPPYLLLSRDLRYIRRST